MQTGNTHLSISNAPSKGRGEAKIGSKVTSELVYEYSSIVAKRQSLLHALSTPHENRMSIVAKILATIDSDDFDNIIAEMMKTVSFIQPHLAETFQNALSTIATDDHIIELFAFMLDFDKDDCALIDEVALLTGFKRSPRDFSCKDYAIRVFPQYIKVKTPCVRSAYKTVIALLMMMQETPMKEKRLFDVLERIVSASDQKAWDTIADYEQKWLTLATLREIELSEPEVFELA